MKPGLSPAPFNSWRCEQDEKQKPVNDKECHRCQNVKQEDWRQRITVVRHTKCITSYSVYSWSLRYLQEILGQGCWGRISYRIFSSLWYHLKGVEPQVVWFNGQNSSWETWHSACDPAHHTCLVETRCWMPQIKYYLPEVLKPFCKSPQQKKKGGEDITAARAYQLLWEILSTLANPEAEGSKSTDVCWHTLQAHHTSILPAILHGSRQERDLFLHVAILLSHKDLNQTSRTGRGRVSNDTWPLKASHMGLLVMWQIEDIRCRLWDFCPCWFPAVV